LPASADASVEHTAAPGMDPAPTPHPAGQHYPHFGPGPAPALLPGMSQGERPRNQRDILRNNYRRTHANRPTPPPHRPLAPPARQLPLRLGAGPARASVAGMSQGEVLRIDRDILGKNDRLAAANRATLAAHGILALNLVSSPGSGKTSLLVSTLHKLAGRIPAAVIEGDQQTEFDAERIRATGVAALQINTGKGCHLDADMIARPLPRLALADGGLLFIENVGNLVCPAAFDLGEAHKVVILSVTEGEDKPLKYPDMFAAADLMLLNKVDLLPYLHFDVERAIGYALRVNPRLQVIRTSATSGEGLDAWLAWLEARRADVRRSAS